MGDIYTYIYIPPTPDRARCKLVVTYIVVIICLPLSNKEVSPHQINVPSFTVTSPSISRVSSSVIIFNLKYPHKNSSNVVYILIVTLT